MRIMYFLASVPLLLLMGCQSMGDHYNCMAEVDRTVPAQTQQKYLRTDTKCTKSNEQSLGGGMGTIYNPAQGDVSCSSVPIYETTVLNQAQRDVAYQQCRGRVNTQRQVQQKNQPTYTSDKDLRVHPYALFDAQQQCGSANPRGTDAFQNCVNVLTKGNAPPQPQQSFSDAEWKSKVEKNKQVQTELLRKKRIAEDGCIKSGLTPNTQEFNQCVYKNTSK